MKQLNLTLTALLILGAATPQVQAMDLAIQTLNYTKTMPLIRSLTIAAIIFFLLPVRLDTNQCEEGALKRKRQEPIWGKIPKEPSNALRSQIELAKARLKHINKSSPNWKNQKKESPLFKEGNFLENWIARYDWLNAKNVFRHGRLGTIAYAPGAISTFLKNYWGSNIGAFEMAQEPK